MTRPPDAERLADRPLTEPHPSTAGRPALHQVEGCYNRHRRPFQHPCTYQTWSTPEGAVAAVEGMNDCRAVAAAVG